MNRKYPCLLLIFLVLAPSTTFVKASKETTFVTVSTFHSKFLDGTWKFVNENGNVSVIKISAKTFTKAVNGTGSM